MSFILTQRRIYTRIVSIGLLLIVTLLSLSQRQLYAEATGTTTVTASGPWQRSNPGGGGALHAVGAGPTGTILVASDLSGAYISKDKGVTWDAIGASQG